MPGNNLAGSTSRLLLYCAVSICFSIGVTLAQKKKVFKALIISNILKYGQAPILTTAGNGPLPNVCNALPDAADF